MTHLAGPCALQKEGLHTNGHSGDTVLSVKAARLDQLSNYACTSDHIPEESVFVFNGLQQHTEEPSVHSNLPDFGSVMLSMLPCGCYGILYSYARPSALKQQCRMARIDSRRQPQTLLFQLTAC